MFGMSVSVVLGLLLCASCCTAHKGVRSGLRTEAVPQSATLQPWLVGLSAVVGFLFLVFVIVIVKSLLQKDREDEGDDAEDHCYDNKVLMIEDGVSKQTSL